MMEERGSSATSPATHPKRRKLGRPAQEQSDIPAHQTVRTYCRAAPIPTGRSTSVEGFSHIIGGFSTNGSLSGALDNANTGRYLCRCSKSPVHPRTAKRFGVPTLPDNHWKVSPIPGHLTNVHRITSRRNLRKINLDRECRRTIPYSSISMSRNNRSLIF